MVINALSDAVQTLTAWTTNDVQSDISLSAVHAIRDIRPGNPSQGSGPLLCADAKPGDALDEASRSSSGRTPVGGSVAWSQDRKRGFDSRPAICGDSTRRSVLASRPCVGVLPGVRSGDRQSTPACNLEIGTRAQPPGRTAALFCAQIPPS